MMSLEESVLQGDRLALARLLTQIENDTAGGRVALNVLFPHAGKAVTKTIAFILLSLKT